jgi:hypothetical protein
METLHQACHIDVIRVWPLAWIRGRVAYVIDGEKSKDTLKSLAEAFYKDLVS